MAWFLGGAQRQLYLACRNNTKKFFRNPDEGRIFGFEVLTAVIMKGMVFWL
jgi:hypothetical protein